MMPRQKTFKQEVSDFFKQGEMTPLCKGHVHIYSCHKNDNNKDLLIDTSNHIVIAGRHWLMQRMFGIPYDISDQKQEWSPAWFAVGDGGAALDTPFQPVWPTDDDVALFNPLQFNSTGGPRYTLDRMYKLIDGVSFVSSLTTKLTMTVDYTDCASHYINEAGIFVSPSQAQDETNFCMFSHVTFPTIPKSDLVKLIIEWYFIF